MGGRCLGDSVMRMGGVLSFVYFGSVTSRPKVEFGTHGSSEGTRIVT